MIIESLIKIVFNQYQQVMGMERRLEETLLEQVSMMKIRMLEIIWNLEELMKTAVE